MFLMPGLLGRLSCNLCTRLNFHTHTTRSDGRLNPHTVVDRYHEHGYSILAITDHNEVTWPWTAFAEMEASGTSQNRMESATETMPERPVWGYSNDDMHTEPHIGRNWNMLILPELSHDWVRTGMVEGLSYFVYVPGGHNGPEAPVIESDVDVILHVTPQHFRPQHFEAAVQARKHIFIEKPGGVDPVGVRIVMAAGRMAESAGLVVVAGTNFRHQRDYLTTRHMVRNGAIGDLVSASAWDIRGKIWHVNRQPGWSDMEAMLRDWMNWNWLSGGDNVDIAVHQIDMVSLYFGKHPVKALGFGGRHRRPTGNIYDYYSVEYEFDDGRIFNCKTRCIDGCDNKHGFMIFGTKGYTNCQNRIWDNDGNLTWEYEYPLDEEGRPTNRVAISSYDEEHINFVTAIRNNTPLNQTQDLAAATLCGVMGRESAITGRVVTWDDMMASNLRLGPTEYAMGPVPGVDTELPVPGTAPEIERSRGGG